MADRMSAEGRAYWLALRVGVPTWTADFGRMCAVIAATIEECRRHAAARNPDFLDYWTCRACRWVSSAEPRCEPYRRLSAPLLAVGVPEGELRP